MSDLSNPQTPPTLTFEQALARLEQIVTKLEDGRVDLAESLSSYEEGVRLLRQCHSLLERAERRIELLSGVDADGRPISEPFDDRATISLDGGAPTRSKRRSSKKADPCGNDETAPAPDVDEPKGLF
jgi:exodeoxyribonuclease VII small subunit